MGAPELSQYYTEKSDDGRNYKHPFRTGPDGKPLKVPSITTVLKFEAKDNLIQWAANMTAEFYAKNPTLSMERSTEDAKRSGQYYYKNFRDERAEVGTGVHEYIEQLLTDGWDFPELDDEQKRIIDRWHEFNEVYTLEPVLVESTLWNHTYNYAGTADGCTWITGPGTNFERILLWDDKKTSKNTWPGHWMQLSALKNCEVVMHKNSDGTWSEEPMPPTVGAAVIHLREDKWEFLMLENEEIRFRQFLAYRDLFELDQQLKAKEKSDMLVTKEDF